MSRFRPFASLIATLALAGACKKDTPAADKSAPPPPAPAPTTTKAAPPSNTKAAAPSNTKSAAPNSNTKVAPQGAARPGGSKTAKPPAAAPSAAGASELAAAQNVRTVQVSAYASPTPANWWVGELRRQNIPAYMVQATINGQNWYRIRIGATLTGAEARDLAAKIHARYKWPTWIVMVDDKSVFSGDELQATRAYLSSSK